MSTGTHLFRLNLFGEREQRSGGLRIKAHKRNFPVLQGMSLYTLLLEPKGVREPHWHANAAELGYCKNGKVLVSLYGNEDEASSFLVQTGEVFLIPSGVLHGIQNIGEEAAELILSFSSDDPEDFNLSTTMGMFSNSVLGNTWGKEADYFASFKRVQEPTFIAICNSGMTSNALSKIPYESHYKTPYLYNLEGAEPLLSNGGGSARMARQNVWPIAKNQALYSLRLTGKGMREPHWHPETSELGYVNRGRGRMSILNPSGNIDTYVMEEGDIYFIPKAYPHHIENIDDSQDLHVLVFFDQGMPKDIGFTGSVPFYTSALLAASTQSPQSLFEGLPRYYRDSFIVDKVNPVDL